MSGSGSVFNEPEFGTWSCGDTTRTLVTLSPCGRSVVGWKNEAGNNLGSEFSIAFFLVRTAQCLLLAAYRLPSVCWGLGKKSKCSAGPALRTCGSSKPLASGQFAIHIHSSEFMVAPSSQYLPPDIRHLTTETRTQSFFPTYHLRHITYQTLTTFFSITFPLSTSNYFCFLNHSRFVPPVENRPFVFIDIPASFLHFFKHEFRNW